MGKRILYVGLSRSKSRWKIGSFLIRFVETPRSLFNPQSWAALYHSSHAFIVYPAHSNRPFYLVNEAAGAMVRFVSQPHFDDHAQITRLYKFEFDRAVYKRIQTYGELHLGAPYAFLENAGIVLVRLAKLFGGRQILNPFGVGDRAQKCTELVVRNVLSHVVALDELPLALLQERGHVLPEDVELIGVRDIEEILEYLADGDLCERVDVSSALRIGKAA